MIDSGVKSPAAHLRTASHQTPAPAAGWDISDKIDTAPEQFQISNFRFQIAPLPLLNPKSKI
jgi:hypothetical protein